MWGWWWGWGWGACVLCEERCLCLCGGWWGWGACVLCEERCLCVGVVGVGVGCVCPM